MKEQTETEVEEQTEVEEVKRKLKWRAIETTRVDSFLFSY